MNKRVMVIGLLMLVSLTAYSQVTLVEAGEDGPKFSLTGGLTGTFTMGFMEDEQVVMMSGSEASNPNGGGPAPGVFYGEEPGKPGKTGPGKNGYSVSMNFSMLFSPVSYAEVFVKFLAQYRPGSPYIPLQLEDSSAKTFSDFAIDNAWGRVNAIKGLGFDLPLEVWLKGGKYDVTPSQFQNVSRYGAESVMNSLRTTNDYNLQLEASYFLPGTKAITLGLTTHAKLKEAFPVLLNDDDVLVGGTRVFHGDPKGAADIPFRIAAKVDELSLGFADISAELIYAYNAMNIYSGNNFGFDVGTEIPVIEGLSVPVGLGFALYGQNIDPFADTSITSNTRYLSLYGENGYHYSTDLNKSWDSNTTSLRNSFRLGFGVGARYTYDFVTAECNLGFALSQIAHYYRDTLTIPALSFDLRGTFLNHYFIGGGIFLGTLTDMEWKTKEDIDASTDDSNHEFNLAENMGFEAYGGIQMGKAKFVLGYNINKGLSMNNSIESAADAQIKYRQNKDPKNGLFERGGFFAKLALSW